MVTDPRVVVIAQARMGSSRLPGKVLKTTNGTSLIGHLVRRVQQASRPHALVIATTTAPADDAVVKEAESLGVAAFRGSEEDVLARYLGAARHLKAEVVVRITGDCPLLDPQELDRVIGVYLAGLGTDGEKDFVRNQAGAVRRIPHGHDVEVFSMDLLEQAAREASDPGDREHVTPYFYRVEGRFRTGVTDPPGEDLSQLRLTVDTPEDLQLVRAIMDALGPDAGASAIARWAAQNPASAAVNQQVQQRGIDSERQRRQQRVKGKTLFARADAGPGIGFGHVARIEALLDAWTELGGRALLYGSGVTGSIRRRLLSRGIQILDRPSATAPASTPESVPQAGPEDLHETLRLARQEEAVAMAIDGYAFPETYRRDAASALPLLAIDDLASFPCHADVVVNQNMGFPRARYTATPRCQLLVGHPYALFRREFRDAARRGAAAAARAGHRILITFGGSDPARLTLPVTQALRNALQPQDQLVVIAGGAMPAADRAGLDELASSQQQGASVDVLSDVEHMGEVMEGATLAITAAGSTTWELIVCGVPPLAIAVAENQRAVAQGVHAKGAGVDLGWYKDVTPALVRDRTLALLKDTPARERLVTQGRALMDGRGVWRAIDALLHAIDQRDTTA